MKYLNNNLYAILATVASLLFILVFFLLSWWMQRRSLRKIFNTRNIALSAMLIALAVAMNALGNFAAFLGAPLRFGNILVFITGMIFGPMMGMTSGLIVDFITGMIFSFGSFNFGFTLGACLFGFFGSLVFVWRTNKWTEGKLATIFIVYYVFYSFVISTLSMGMYSWNLAFANMGAKAIRLCWELVIYVSLTEVCFELLMQLIQHRWAKQSFIWALRKGSIHFKPRKSKYDKMIEKAKSKNEVKA